MTQMGTCGGCGRGFFYTKDNNAVVCERCGVLNYVNQKEIW